MDRGVWIFLLMVAALLAVAFTRGGGLWLSGLQTGARSFWGLLPTLLLSFAIAGLLQVLIPRQMVMSWFGKGAGMRGILLGCVVGALIPGPPYALYPMVLSLYQGGASMGALIGMLTAKVLWSIQYLPPALAVLGTRFTAIMYLATLVVPPVSGWLAQLLDGRLR